MNLPDGLMAEVKARAAREQRTVTSVVEEALRLLLSDPTEASDERPLPSFGSPDDRFLVDLLDKDALWAVLDADDDPS